MSKKSKKKANKPLDEAARSRIAARRERKAANRTVRERQRTEKAERQEREAEWAAGAAEREVQRAAQLDASAALVVTADGVAEAGLVPAGHGQWELVVRSGNAKPEAPFDDPVEAVLWLLSEATSQRRQPVYSRRLAEMASPDVEHPPLHVPEVEIVACNEAGKALIDHARELLHATYHAGELDEDDDLLFYEHLADAKTKAAIEKQWRE